MVTPREGRLRGVPMTPEARKIADAWDPAEDEAAGNQCKAYGAAAIMRVPGRLHITWQDDNTLKLETDAGTQTRLFHSAPLPAPAARRAGRATRPRSGNGRRAAAPTPPPPGRSAEGHRPRTCAPATCGRTACPTATTRR